MTRLWTDVAIIGAGHNGLIAATFLARHGLRVFVLEEKAVVGGAAKTEYPFARAPRLGTSTGAYLLGVMPPELIAKLGARFTLIRRVSGNSALAQAPRSAAGDRDENSNRCHFDSGLPRSHFARISRSLLFRCSGHTQ